MQTHDVAHFYLFKAKYSANIMDTVFPAHGILAFVFLDRLHFYFFPRIFRGSGPFFSFLFGSDRARVENGGIRNPQAPIFTK